MESWPGRSDKTQLSGAQREPRIAQVGPIKQESLRSFCGPELSGEGREASDFLPPVTVRF